jgi:hypothetical protein
LALAFLIVIVHQYGVICELLELDIDLIGRPITGVRRLRCMSKIPLHHHSLLLRDGCWGPGGEGRGGREWKTMSGPIIAFVQSVIVVFPFFLS